MGNLALKDKHYEIPRRLRLPAGARLGGKFVVSRGQEATMCEREVQVADSGLKEKS